MLLGKLWLLVLLKSGSYLVERMLLILEMVLKLYWLLPVLV